MSTKTSILSFLALSIVLSCTANGPETAETTQLIKREFSAFLDNSITRTSLTSEGKVLWDESGEAVSIVDESGNCYEIKQKSVSDDRKSAVFSGEVPESGCLYALYPVQPEVQIENQLLTLSIPTVQDAVPGSFATATNLAIARLDDSGQLRFKNVCGLVGFCVSSSAEITSIRLKGTETSGGAVTGSALVDYTGDAPDCESDIDLGSDYVEIEGTIQNQQRYYALVFPGTYDNLELTFTDSEGRTATRTRSQAITIARNSVLNFKTFTISGDEWTEAEEPGGTATLTYAEASSSEMGYNKPFQHENSYGTWTICAYKETSKSAFQLNGGKVAYIGTPTFPGVIKSIKIQNKSTSTTGEFIICKSSGDSNPPSGDNVTKALAGSGEYVIDVSSLGAKQLFVRSSKVSHITELTVVWGGNGGSVDPDPDPDPDPEPPLPIPDPNGLADYGWFELPAQTDKNADGIDDNVPDYYYSHTFREDAPKIRNFSCCYSKGNMQPVWVAAPMHNCYKGSSGRNDSYKSDPNIKCQQAGKVDGYTRGHMLGSSDRTVSKPTNRQVFYYSNIGAQMSTGFNTGGGSWNNLESLTDGQWCADTLYQVIGCIFKSFTDRYGKTVSPRTVDGVHIPTAYYKVLLRTRNGKTGKRVDQCQASELKCAAFILGHRANAGHKPTADDMYTVEELEALTGLTFFVNVPNAPKSVAVPSDWGL